MKIKDLIEQLEKFDPDLYVYGWTEDEDLMDKNRGFIIFEILRADLTEGEFIRLDDGSPSVKLGKSDFSQKFVTLDISKD